MIDHRLSLLQLIEMNCLGLYWNTSGVSSFASLDLTTEQMIVSIHRTLNNNYTERSEFDAYHSPFAPKHRYWVGLLLLARIVYNVKYALTCT